MLFIEMTGLSGSGKSTIASLASSELTRMGYKNEVIDGDVYRKTLCKDLGFSEADRKENIRRLGIVCNLLSKNGIIAMLAAINPFEETRNELKNYGDYVKLVWINCDLETLTNRDTKDLYRRARLPEGDPDRITNLTGVNDRFDIPKNYDLVIDTSVLTIEQSVKKMVDFIIMNLS